jgi:hypothetical protein
MKIEKVIKSQIPTNYFFITGNIGTIDTKYLINRIEEGINLPTNISYETNIIGEHTSWDYFCNNKVFLKNLNFLIDYLDEHRVTEYAYKLRDAWGLKEGWGEYTQEHNHAGSYISGVIYLNDHPQKLCFPEINEKIKPKPGTFVLFSSFLKHYTARNSVERPKYALSFNFGYNTMADKPKK